MDTDLRITTCPGSTDLDSALWRKRLQVWLDRLNLSPHTQLSVTLTDDRTIANLNRQYRGTDRPTDVLAFPAPADFPAAPGAPVPLGDIIVSVERAREQAQEYDHPLERELGFLLVHGLLHLLAYDHQTPAEEKVMRAKQEELLEAVGLSRSRDVGESEARASEEETPSRIRRTPYAVRRRRDDAAHSRP